jgi:hypothetical protein
VSLQGLRDLPEKSHQPGFAASRSKANAPLKQEQSVPRVLLPDAGYDHREVDDPHTNKSAFDYEHTGPFNFSLMDSKFTTDCALVDGTFGPWAGPHCRSGFDFTLLFEESILSILPTACVLAIAPFRIFQLCKKQNKLRRSRLLFTKLVREA